MRLHPSLYEEWDWPHTIVYVLALRRQYNSYLELPKPIPEEHWDFPHLVRQHIDDMYSSKDKSTAQVDIEEIEE